MADALGSRDPIQVRQVEYPLHDDRPRRVPSEPRFGVVSPADIHPAVTVRDRDEIIASFRLQDLRLPLGGELIALRACDAREQDFPFAHPVLLVSTTVREYLPWPNDVRGLDFIRVTAAAADRQWVDRMLLLKDAPEAWDIAREFGGRFAMRWDTEGAAVVDLQTGEVVDGFHLNGSRLRHRPCPLIPGAVCGDRCKMYGGPWVTQSMVASGYWMDRRFLYEQDLGCDEQCSRPSVRRRTDLPTRYYTWLWQSEIDNRWEDLVAFVRSH